MRPEFDDRDADILANRQAKLDERQGPRVGDFVVFADGVSRRISHAWEGDNPGEGDYQTSNEGGGYYLGSGYVSFSGTLYRSVPGSSLTLTDERREGRVWVFHHDFHEAHNAVEGRISFRVYRCSQEAPT